MLKNQFAKIWLDRNFSDLKPVKKHNRVYYMKNDKPILYYNGKDTMYVSTPNLWDLMEVLFVLNYSQIKKIIREWLKDTYDISGYDVDSSLEI